MFGSRTDRNSVSHGDERKKSAKLLTTDAGQYLLKTKDKKDPKEDADSGVSGLS
jgi:hypothetical protein